LLNHPGVQARRLAADTGRVMKRAALVIALGLVVVGAASASERPHNLTPPKLYGEFVAGRPVTVDPGRWTGSPTFRFMWERCTKDGSLCKPAPDLGDESASTVRPGRAQGADVGVRLRTLVAADGGDWVWTALSPVITASARPTVQTKGGIDPYTPPRVGTLLQPYFSWAGSPRSVRYLWQRCGVSRCVEIAGATHLDYRVRAADVGSRLRIVSIATAGGGSASASQTTKPVR
jgi:hypothetical protein